MDLKELLFDSGSEVGEGSEEALLKALEMGYGVNAENYTGARALQGEDCETTLVNVMREEAGDFKLMNTIKKTPVKSTVHQYNERTDVGDEDLGFVAEGGIAPDNNQEILRKAKEMKYIQKRGVVTEQAIQAETFEPAFETEKIATTLSVLRTAEKYSFHGDSKVVPKQFDGLLALIKNTPVAKRNVKDLEGKTIQTYGEGIFTEMAEMIADRGGKANKVFYPLILGNDIQELARDRLRLTTEDEKLSTVIKQYPTLHGSLLIADEAGPDLMFKAKNVIKPTASGEKIPNKPSAVNLVASSNGKSKFHIADAGTYTYMVHSVNEYGISEGTDATPIAVANGDAVTISITPAATNPGTGFIISRSLKGGNTVMEMIRIGIDTQQAETEFVDLNEDLPGTAEMLFLTEKKLQVVTEFLQFLPLRLYRKEDPLRLVTPFIMALWGAPSIKAPHWCGVVKNIGYRGGLYA
ncbi:MAG: hypothetical protein LBQ89_08190 [Treponema sp.]|jgi:hypothetical protein|nr:hypothetical protein [Treponema sp.]